MLKQKTLWWRIIEVSGLSIINVVLFQDEFWLFFFLIKASPTKEDLRILKQNHKN